jgi:hypothetical protein
VWRNPALLLVAVGVGFVTSNGVRPIPGATVADIAFALATLLVIPLILVRRPSYLSIPGWFSAAAAGFGITVLASAVTSTAVGSNVVDGAKFMIALAITPVLVATVAASSVRVALLVDVWILGAVVNAAVGTIDFLGLAVVGPKLTGLAFIDRSSGLTTHPNHLGLVAAMALPVALSRVLGASSGRRIAYLVAIFVLCFGILSSGSRAELVAGAVGIVALPLLHAKARKQILLGFALGVVVLALAAAILPAARSHALVAVHRLTGNDPSVSVSDSERRVALRAGLSDFRAHPLTGNGYATVRDAHMVYLQLLAAGGILALGAFLVFAYGVLAVGLRLRSASDFAPSTQNLAAALTASMGVWLASGVVSNQVYDRYLYLPAGLLLGLWFARRRPEVRGDSVPTHPIQRRMNNEVVAGRAADHGAPGAVPVAAPSGSAICLSFAPTMRRAVPLLAAVIVALAAAVGIYAIATRGDSGSPSVGASKPVASNAAKPTTTTASQSSHLLSQGDIDRYPSASPQHALLAWWRAAQFADYGGYVEAFDKQFRPGLRTHAKTRQALAAFAGFADAAEITVVDAHKGAGRATVYATINYRARAPSGKLFVQTYPRTFKLVRRADRWLLQNDDFVQEILPPSLRRT